MLDILSDLKVVPSSDYKFYPILAFLQVRMLLKKQGVCLQSEIDIFLAFISIEGEEIGLF